MKRIGEHFGGWIYAVFALVTLCVFFACVCLGSVRIPLRETMRVIADAIRGVPNTWGSTTTTPGISVATTSMSP